MGGQWATPSHPRAARDPMPPHAHVTRRGGPKSAKHEAPGLFSRSSWALWERRLLTHGGLSPGLTSSGARGARAINTPNQRQGRGAAGMLRGAGPRRARVGCTRSRSCLWFRPASREAPHGGVLLSCCEQGAGDPAGDGARGAGMARARAPRSAEAPGRSSVPSEFSAACVAGHPGRPRFSQASAPAS